jgi:branched-chain amino acid transport system substrate-binding protein
MKLGGPATDGHYCSMPGVPLEKMAKGPDFKEKFTKKYNAEIQLYAPNVYDAVMVMVDSMKRANSVEPAKYLPEVGKTSYEGVTAKIAFDEKGDLKGGAISLYQFKAGKLEYVETLGGGVAEAVADAAKATGDAAKAVGSAAVDMAKEGTKAATEMVKDAADATKAAADATKAAVEKK